MQNQIPKQISDLWRIHTILAMFDFKSFDTIENLFV